MSEQEVVHEVEIPAWDDLKPELREYVITLLERELAKARHDAARETLAKLEAKEKFVDFASMMPPDMAAGAAAGFAAMSKAPPVSPEVLALSSALDVLCPQEDEEEA